MDLFDTNCFFVDAVSAMAAVRNSAEKEKEVESAECYTQELSGSPTSSPTTSTHNNNSSSVGPQQCQSLDSHQSLLNGAQPNPFVCGGVLAAPCTDDSLPSGAIVNGSASHCTSEELHVPNKDASPLAGTDTNPEVLEPPCELQSNTWQKPEGHIMKAPSTRTLSESDNSYCETPLVEDNADNRAISRVWTNNGVKTGSLWDVDSESESSSDNYDGLNRSLREKFMCFLLKGRILDEVVKGKIKVGGLQSASSRRRKRKTCKVKRIPIEDKVNEGFSCESLINMDLDFDSSISEEHSLMQNSESLKAHIDFHLGNSQDKKNLISSDNAGGYNEADTYVGGQPMPLKREQETDFESEHSFFQCTKCNVNFKEKRHLHRHMMYHLDWHNRVEQASIHPFICKECGRSFCEHSSLQKHMLIHQVRREKLMEEIKDLKELRSKKGEAQLRCPQGAFETNCPQTLINHAQTHEKDKPFYYSCEECNHIVLNESDMEAHQQIAHLSACQGRVIKPLGMLFCKICTFRTKYRDNFRKHLKLVHDQPLWHYELQSHSMAAHLTGSVSEQDKITGQTEMDNLSPPLLKPKFLREKQNKSGARLSAWSNNLADLFLRDNSTQKSCKSLSSSLIKWSFGSLANNLSPSSLQCDKPSKLSLPTERIDVTKGLSYGEEDNQKCESAVSKQNTKYLSSLNLATKSADSSKAVHLDYDDVNTSKGPSPGSRLAVETQKSPSKRKMSIPYHNTPKKKIPIIVPKHQPERTDICSTGNYRSAHFDCANQSKAHYLHNSDASDPLTQQGNLLKDDVHNSPDQSDLDSNVESEDEISTLIVKEENMESAVSEDNPDCTDPNLSDSFTSYCVSPVFEPERKCCPYCPAMFESGVGLSNHIRGHLHRCGLSYEARHMLSTEQVASQDRQPRIRRRATSMNNRIRKGELLLKNNYPIGLKNLLLYSILLHCSYFPTTSYSTSAEWNLGTLVVVSDFY